MFTLTLTCAFADGATENAIPSIANKISRFIELILVFVCSVSISKFVP